MPKRQKPAKTPKRLMRAHTPAINLTDEIKASTEILRKQRTNVNVEHEYALITTTKSVELKDINDEFSREFNFNEQAKSAAMQAIAKLKELGIPTEIPKAYKGDMVKDDNQMAKIRENLKSLKEGIKKSEDLKKLRYLKKMGKKIKDEVLKKRSKEKKEFLEQVKKKPTAELFN